MDLVSIILCMCIGNAVAWLMAIYTPGGAYNLLWNVILGSAGAAVCALAIGWALPAFGVAGLLFLGPPCAILAILAGQALKDSIRRRGGVRVRRS